MENKQHRSFLEICQEFVKVSEIATPFLNYEGIEVAINLQKDAHLAHLNDLKQEVWRWVDADREAAEDARRAAHSLMIENLSEEEWKEILKESGGS